ncbi:MAG: hypothetical protein IT562_02915 [Alphaproteobacteria bacterium]|nr:hypothetical protein [Alphaproteobacteria bacterium]
MPADRAAHPRKGKMRLGIFSSLAIFLVVALAAGAAFLALWEPKPPSHVIERTIPDDKLPR